MTFFRCQLLFDDRQCFCVEDIVLYHIEVAYVALIVTLQSCQRPIWKYSMLSTSSCCMLDGLQDILPTAIQ